MLIAHISDIQIRALQRHEEFEKHFENLYSSLRKNKVDLIVLAGDIVHQKVLVSPELFRVCSDFFINLASIAPTHIIPGNHDLLLHNQDRLDVLTPIVKAINNKNIFYYKHSGVHKIQENLQLVVFSCLDKESEWPKDSDIDQSAINIGLFHGMIKGCMFENDMVVEDDHGAYDLSAFLSKVDYLMLGDIHRTQVLDADFRSGYCGSLIQQNYGEGTKKGYFLWDIKGKNEHELDFVELPNVCPYYTLNLDESLTVPSDLDFQQKCRIKVVSKPLLATEEKEIRDELVRRFAPVEVKFSDDVNISTQVIKSVAANIDVEKIRDISVQENLIKKYLSSQNISDSVLEKVFLINKKLNAFLNNEDETNRNVRYRIDKIKFSNLFSYGEENVLDFTKLKGVVGVFGRNGVGKSSLVVDIPSFCLFNKISKEGAVKNDLYVNDHSEDGSVEADISIDQDRYSIKRKVSLYYSGKRSGKMEKKSRTELTFQKFVGGKELIDLTGIERSDTDQEIKKTFGTAEDFLITAIAPQFELTNFIKVRGTDRKKIIGRYFDLEVFEKKYELANEELKQIKKNLKKYEDKNFELVRIEILQKMSSSQKNVDELQRQISDLTEQKNAVSARIIEQKVSQETKQKSGKQSKIFELETNLKYVNQKLFDKNREAKEFAKYTCLSNPDCCMQERQKKVLESIREIENQKKSWQEAIENVKNQEEPAVVALNFQDTLKDEIHNLSSSINELVSKKNSLLIEVGRCDAMLSSLEVERKQFEELKEEYDAYSYFLAAMGKDGISYNIISENLHIINFEIKKILSGLFNFDIYLEDEDKEINIYLKHLNNEKRLIEVCGGMEKTVAALVIRIALMHVTTLPIPNIIVLDEIFDSLDGDNLESVTRMLQAFRGTFDTIFVITHSDAVKDICDSIIFVERDASGVSRIVY